MAATPERSQQLRFFGAVVSSELVVGLFFDVLVVGRDVLVLRPLGRRNLPLHRDELEVVEFERQWAPPFWFKTVIRFRLSDGTYAPKVMIALRTRAVRQALHRAGWPVAQVQFGGTKPTGSSRSSGVS